MRAVITLRQWPLKEKSGHPLGCYYLIKIDDLAKSLKMPFFVLSAKDGIQDFQRLINTMDSGFPRSDDF
jgi:hypothetical protein